MNTTSKYGTPCCLLCEKFSKGEGDGWAVVDLYSPEEKALYGEMLHFISHNIELFYTDLEKRFGKDLEVFENVLDRILAERWITEPEELNIGIYKVFACPLN